ncbi:hypothetical protein SAMN05216203_2863 [Marinobacter daqiaonensis]|uniref:VOC domain-containing protein n=1 Tax=Marinobacter daqiaonensis TaxID=650891 RepID=A0A1I6JBK7_9GAMM|nr:VOC family protein [Marinobacter daqiaonensis]SFR76377.1 hypothetical protein SAMN05216203_2863 [Marinobacter daqiaonensis]
MPMRDCHFRGLPLLLSFMFFVTLTGCDWATVLGEGKDEDDNNSGEELDPVISQVIGFELGVSSLDMSVPVYREGLGMDVVEETETGTSRRVTLESPGSSFVATLTLIEFTDGLGRNLQDNPGRIVYSTPDAQALANQFANAGGNVTQPPLALPGLGVVGFGRDPDNNLIEFTEVPQVTSPLMSAVGIGVSDLEAARDFYDFRVGLTEQDFRSTERYDEYIMGSDSAGGALSLVLLHWTDDTEQRYRGNETRIRLVSEDPDEVVERTFSEEDGRTQDRDGNRLIIDEDPVDIATP